MRKPLADAGNIHTKDSCYTVFISQTIKPGCPMENQYTRSTLNVNILLLKTKSNLIFIYYLIKIRD
jgi:hypothetical protein